MQNVGNLNFQSLWRSEMYAWFPMLESLLWEGGWRLYLWSCRGALSSWAKSFPHLVSCVLGTCTCLWRWVLSLYIAIEEDQAGARAKRKAAYGRGGRKKKIRRRKKETRGRKKEKRGRRENSQRRGGETSQRRRGETSKGRGRAP